MLGSPVQVRVAAPLFPASGLGLCAGVDLEPHFFVVFGGQSETGSWLDHQPAFTWPNEIATSLFAALICTIIEYPVAAFLLRGQPPVERFAVRADEYGFEKSLLGVRSSAIIS
jgi:hypothetical protein